MLLCLGANGLITKPQKYEWGANQPEYLRDLVGDGKVAVPEARVEAVRKCFRDQRQSVTSRHSWVRRGIIAGLFRDTHSIPMSLQRLRKMPPPGTYSGQNICCELN